MFWRFLCFLCFVLISAASAQAQSEYTDKESDEEYAPQWLGSFYGDIGFPLRQFERNMDETGFGFGGELLYNVQYQQPVWAGIGVHSFAFDDYSLIYTEIFDGELFEYREVTASRLFVAHVLFRFQPDLNFFLQPYVQGGFGMHWFFTNTKIEDRDIDEIVERYKENKDSAFGYSLHAGLQFVPKGAPEIRVDLRVGYFKNPSAEYMRYDPSLGEEDSFPIDYFETRTSAVDFLGLHGGMTFLF